MCDALGTGWCFGGHLIMRLSGRRTKVEDGVKMSCAIDNEIEDTPGHTSVVIMFCLVSC